MKRLLNLFIILFFTGCFIFTIQNNLKATPNRTNKATQNRTDALVETGLPANFEWRDEYYTVYWDFYNNGPTSVTSPYCSDAIGELLYTKDYEPEDGWVLVTGNFGSSQGYIANPYFIMYNKYEGLLRVFVLINSPENYSNASMKLSFGNDSKTALLTHASNRAWAVDNFKQDNIILATFDMFNHEWLYADFAMAYDPNTNVKTDSRLKFKLFGVTLTDLTINGTINLTQELPKSSMNSGNLSTFDQITVTGKKIAGYYSTFNGYKSQLIKQTNKENDSKLKTALNSLSNSWIVKDLPFIGAAVGLVDFFVGGGRSTATASPVPMVFNGDMNLEGTLTTYDRITQFTMQTPGTDHGNITANIPYYDKPLGIFNLTESPVLQWHDYYQYLENGISMEWTSYKVKNDIHYIINPNANLSLHSLDVALVFRLPENFPSSDYRNPPITNWLNQGIYEIENSEKSNHYVLRTKYIPYNLLKNTVINAPYGTDITIKVKAVLKRNDAPSGTQNILYVADYDGPTWEEVTTGSDPFPWTSDQQVPSKPRNLTCSFSSSNHPVLHWDLGVGIEKYEIWKNDGVSSTWSKFAEVGPSVYQYEDITETLYNPHSGNKIYKYYKIRAIDYATNPSVYSDKVSVALNGMSILNKNGYLSDDFDYALFDNYPNPFNPTTQINYQMPKNGFVSLVVYNTLGQKVATLVNEMQESGVYKVNFNAENLPSGIYVYKIQAGEFSEVKKMLLLK